MHGFLLFKMENLCNNYKNIFSFFYLIFVIFFKFLYQINFYVFNIIIHLIINYILKNSDIKIFYNIYIYHKFIYIYNLDF